VEQGAEWILILNNDTVLGPDAIEHLLDAARSYDGRVGGVVPKILYHDEPDRIWYAGGEFSPLRGLGIHWKDGELDDPGDSQIRDVSFMTGCCCLLSAEAMGQLGGFAESFFAYVEDAELSLRLGEAGYRMLYQPRARVLHHSAPPGSEPSPFQIRQRDRNRRRVMRTHFSYWQRVPFLFRFYLTRLIRLSQYALRGDWDRGHALVDGMTKP
jgi:GT2 family glycosyltransferase